MVVKTLNSFPINISCSDRLEHQEDTPKNRIESEKAKKFRYRLGFEKDEDVLTYLINDLAEKLKAKPELNTLGACYRQP